MGNRLNVFISYRRADSSNFSGRLHDNLKNDFDVFYDTEGGIDYGEEFPAALIEGIEKADIFLMVIGKKSCEEFKLREGKPDFVLKEILHAQQSSCLVLPILMDGVNMPNCLPKEIANIAKLNAYEFRHNKFSVDLADLREKLQTHRAKSPKLINKGFVQDVLDGIEEDRLVVLFSQDLTDIADHYQNIKLQMKSKFSDKFYTVAIPSYVDEEEEYFTCIADDCGMSCDIKRVNDWNIVMRGRLKERSEPLMLLVTEIENGNQELDKQFANILRNLKNEFAHFHALFIGRKALAYLVYGEGNLSPLNNAKQMFFPDEGMKLGEEKITQLFHTLGSKYRPQLCKLLEKKSLGRYSTWSYNETINQLFWKNLLVKNGKNFAWRGELTKEVGRDVLGCDES